MDSRSGRSWRVLLLEDDEALREHVLLPALANYGFDARGVASISGLQEALRQESPDILILDVGLPDGDGFEVAREVRVSHPEIGIVMLTGRGATPDRVLGLALGADAYLPKPVEVDLLAATLRSLVRRLKTPDHVATPPPADRWHMDSDGWCLVSPKGAAIPLTKTERRLVARLLESPGRLVRREHLIEALTTNVFEFDPHRLDALIHRVRRKAEHCGAPLPLSLVHGEGYVFKE
ncbi:response regulator transcription factor [Lysobacter arenosi]|uniref:Response regulator transcription factor n=1 Tax=Lysobacter arenosi TaxID=2795387 RepID=A0ABX7R7Y2_9GAMM|nr:response regulator transcription factor [Lysobacter arenosi]QSX73502.1 response regulator transcription factor [Lysobacter arenosi]